MTCNNIVQGLTRQRRLGNIRVPVIRLNEVFTEKTKTARAKDYFK